MLHELSSVARRALLQKRPPRNTQKSAKMHVCLPGEHSARFARTSKRQQAIAKCKNSSDGISAAEQSARRSTCSETQDIYRTLHKKYYVIFYILNCVNCIQAIISYNFAILCIGYLLPAQQREQFFCCLTHILWIKSHKEHKRQFTQC